MTLQMAPIHCITDAATKTQTAQDSQDRHGPQWHVNANKEHARKDQEPDHGSLSTNSVAGGAAERQPEQVSR
jgi:hypothetical protein